MHQQLIRTLIVAVVCALCAGPVWAQSFSDSALLPEYCQHTKGGETKDPVAIQEYEKLFGSAFNHLHHYCRGLVKLQEAAQIIDNNMLRDSKYRRATVEFNYVLARSDRSFVLRPEMLVKKGVALLAIDNDVDAILCFREAVSLRPDYVPAYIALSSYLQRIGATAEARRVLEAGLTRAANNKALQSKLNELGQPTSSD